jgi:hypothetical protein
VRVIQLPADARALAAVSSLMPLAAERGAPSLTEAQQDTQHMGGKMEVSKTFRCDEDFADWLRRQTFDLETDFATIVLRFSLER